MEVTELCKCGGGIFHVECGSGALYQGSRTMFSFREAVLIQRKKKKKKKKKIEEKKRKKMLERIKVINTY